MAESFEVVNKTAEDLSLISLSSSSSVECSHLSVRQRKPEFSHDTIKESSAVFDECGASPDSIDKKLSSLLEQTSELKEIFRSQNQVLRNEIVQMSAKKKEISKNQKLHQKRGNQEVLLSDDESDYSIIIPSENALQKKDESILIRDTLLQLHDLSNSHTELSRQLAEERLKADSFSRLLDEKEEQNKLLKQFFESAKYQMLNNIQLHSELDSVKNELMDMKLKMDELHKKCEESNKEVEDYKVRLEKLQASNADTIDSLQAEKKLLQESLSSAECSHSFDRSCLALAEQKLEDALKERKDMGELLSSLKIENEELKKERAIKEREYQEHLDDLTAKLVNAEQKLEKVQINLSLNIGSQNPSTANSSLTNLDDSDGLPLSDERDEKPSEKNQEVDGFRCPYCFRIFSANFDDMEVHMLDCADMYV